MRGGNACKTGQKNSKIEVLLKRYVSVAQLDRAQASDAWCRWFESNRVHQKRHPFWVSFLRVFGRSKRRSIVGSREKRSFDALAKPKPQRVHQKNRLSRRFFVLDFDITRGLFVLPSACFYSVKVVSRRNVHVRRAQKSAMG